MSSDFDAGDPPKSPGAHCERDGGGGEDGAGNGKKREARQQGGKLHLQHGEGVKKRQCKWCKSRVERSTNWLIEGMKEVF